MIEMLIALGWVIVGAIVLAVLFCVVVVIVATVSTVRMMRTKNEDKKTRGTN